MVKNVLIVGASGEIGYAIARKLANDGYQLMLHYHQNRQVITHLHEQVPSDQLLLEVQADLTTANGVETFIDQLVFPVDAIVFASGTAYYGLFQYVTQSDMDKMLSLHIKAPWLITKQLLPQMVTRQAGNIIFITSIWGSEGASHEVMYSSVKGAQNSFVKALAKEVAPNGVTVNAISPGYIETKMNDGLSAEEKTDILDQIPAGRAGKPEEIAHAVQFLLDEKSAYIQGEIMEINGGW